MKQTIFRILQTERYQYLIYSQNHGIETLDLYGEPITWVCPELERRIKDALSVDTRINYATDFQHDISIKGQVHTSFRVNTIYGDVVAERTVNI
jgi:hypothetical protein